MSTARRQRSREEMAALGFHIMKNGGVMMGPEGPMIWVPGYYEPDLAAVRLSFAQSSALSDWIRHQQQR